MGSKAWGRGATVAVTAQERRNGRNNGFWYSHNQSRWAASQFQMYHWGSWDWRASNNKLRVTQNCRQLSIFSPEWCLNLCRNWFCPSTTSCRLASSGTRTCSHRPSHSHSIAVYPNHLCRNSTISRLGTVTVKCRISKDNLNILEW